MKNDIFNFRRFGKYFATDIKTCWSNYGLSLLSISLLVPIVSYVVLTALTLIMTSSWDGPDMGFRVFAFCVAMFCIVVTMPVKCYGRITDKKYGTFWLTLPASGLEKFLSMVIMTCIVVPVTGLAFYLGMDAIICAIDHTCGNSLMAGGIEFMGSLNSLNELAMNMGDETITIEGTDAVRDILEQVSSPWIYIDEIFGITLPFLLGAIFFKNGKTVKTFLALIAFSTAISIIMAPFLTTWATEIVHQTGDDPNMMLQALSNGIFRHLTLIDTISDTVCNLALMACIWFRIKTLKH